MSLPNYQGVTLPDHPAHEDLQTIVSDYETMLISVMRAIVNRYERNTEYPFIDTKLDLITGEDFPTDDPIRGKNAIYGWIQGRGLEALAGHCRWLRRRNIETDLISRLEHIITDVLAQLDRMRVRNHGRLSFFMMPDGQPFQCDTNGRPQSFDLDPDGPYGFSDLFSAKGMFAAARYLNNTPSTQKALAYCRAVNRAIWEKHFQSDQQPLDPKNPVISRPGHHPHGAFMIQIGTAALLVTEGFSEGIEMGLQLIRHELETYINLNRRIQNLANFDFWEAVDSQGVPYRENGQILSDPGHALECVGLALKWCDAVKQREDINSEQIQEIQQIEEQMLQILNQNFQNGYLLKGICKAFDLVSRKALNTDLPWWNLPETMRAALFCHRVAKSQDHRQMCLHIFAACHNAFVQYFVRPDLHLMAYQTCSASGHPVAVIPATADADPGYHTGLSIIDVLDMIADR